MHIESAKHVRPPEAVHAHEIAMELLAFFKSDPSRWTKNAIGRSRYGRACMFNDYQAVAWDLHGAICKLWGVYAYESIYWRTLKARLGVCQNVAEWNDAHPDFQSFELSLRALARVPVSAALANDNSQAIHIQASSR